MRLPVIFNERGMPTWAGRILDATDWATKTYRDPQTHLVFSIYEDLSPRDLLLLGYDEGKIERDFDCNEMDALQDRTIEAVAKAKHKRSKKS